VYNKIYPSTVQEWMPERTYDFIYLGDVLEHLEIGAGFKTLARLATVCDKVMYIATPLYMRPQGAVLGNVLETHLTQWTSTMFYETLMPMQGKWTTREFGNVLVAEWRLS